MAIPSKGFFEKGMQQLRTDLRLGGAAISIELRTKLGQNLALALLGGFRGVVANFVWVGVYTAYQEQHWHKVKERAELTVVLQPHSVSFWDLGAWHMAYNSSFAESINFKYPTRAYRLKIQRDWIMAGKKFLEEGIQNNPDRYELYLALGRIIYDPYKLNDPLGSIHHLKKAASYPGAPLYIVRMIGHMYTKGGKTHEAYEWWKQLWAQDHEKNPAQLWDKIAQWGHETEEKLGIPVRERVFPSKS